MQGSFVTLPPFTMQRVPTPLSEATDWWFDQLGLGAVHKLTKGNGIRLGIADTGVDASHPELQGALVDAKDFTRSRIGIADKVAHGTWCACAAAARENNVGGIGVAPESQLVIAKVLGDNGSGSNQSVADGIDYLRESGCQVISMSLGGPQPDPYIQAACQRATKAGVFLVCAAGNSGRNSVPNYPAAWNDVCVAVGAVDRNGNVANFSSWGEYVDIACYGQDVLAGVPGGGYARMSGTSMATPICAGVVCLILARHAALGAASKTPIRNVADLIEHLKRGAKDAGDPGKDRGAGWGLINPATAIEPDDQQPVVPPVAGDPYEVHLPGGMVIHVPGKAGDLLSLGVSV